MNPLPIAALLALALFFSPHKTLAADYAEYKATKGPGEWKHVVLLSGDEEYRSEEAMPMLAKILSVRHGFKCTVIFPINPADHTIDPNITTNLPGMGALDSADLCIMALRFRRPQDSQMRSFVKYLNAGKPIIALRTSTHAFAYPDKQGTLYFSYDWQSKDWPGGFGQQVLGETWVSHHGEHGKESTRGVINETYKNHPILRGVADIWGPTDVYTVTHLPKEAEVLVWGQVLSGMNPNDPPVQGKKNDPMMPLVWTRNFAGGHEKESKIIVTTMGAAVDLKNEGLRRLLVNASYWALGIEVPSRANVEYVGEYNPTSFGFGKFRKGLKPQDFELKP